jgi:hypothetical protein
MSVLLYHLRNRRPYLCIYGSIPNAEWEILVLKIHSSATATFHESQTELFPFKTTYHQKVVYGKSIKICNCYLNHFNAQSTYI